MKRRRFFQAVAAAESVTRFFTDRQFAPLTRLCEILQPKMNGAPGAIEAKAPEFLNFLIGESPGDRQQVYRQGLDRLAAAGFVEADAAKATAILAPLKAPWTYDPPADPLARFLRQAKADVRTATVNSREYHSAGAAGGGRRFGAQILALSMRPSEYLAEPLRTGTV
jgi:hypothetical protein